jgi:hypothetical protein
MPSGAPVGLFHIPKNLAKKITTAFKYLRFLKCVLNKVFLGTHIVVKLDQ